MVVQPAGFRGVDEVCNDSEGVGVLDFCVDNV